MARILSPKPESSFAPSHSFCGRTTIWRGTTWRTSLVCKDFARAAEEASYKPEFVKKALTHRLMTAIIEGKSSEVARGAALLGKFKEHDWFVRNADVNIGVFASVAEDPADPTILDADKYPE